MATKHELWAAKPTPRKPKAEIRAAPSSYEITHPVGSAERFLDQAAKEALAAAAAGGIPKVRQLVPGAVKAMVKAADKYPDPLLSEAARLPAEELARRAARAEAFRRTMQANDAILREVSQALSPGETLAKIQLAAGIDSAVQGAARQDAKGGRTIRAAEGAGDTEDTRVRKAVNRGASFIDILRQSAGFSSDVEAEEYLAHVAKKRDTFLKDAKGLRDISPGLLHADAGSHLRLPAMRYLTYGERRSDQFSPIIRRSDRGFLDRTFNLEQKGRIWKHGSEGTEEEVALHPFNTVDQVGRNAATANLVASVLAPFPRGQAYATPTERRLNAHAGIYEQMRFAEFQRAVAGLKRTVLRHINQRDAGKPVAQRADAASQTVREILEKSRDVYENTSGSTADRDDAVFNMLRQDYKDILPHIGATEESTGFPPHVVAAVRAYATLPARARGDGGLYNQWPTTQEKPPVDPKDLTYFIDALDLVDEAVRPSANRHVDSSQADIIDATAYKARQSRADAKRPVHAAEGAGDTKWNWDTYEWNPENRKTGRRINPKNIKGTGIAFDAAKNRLKVPAGREKEFEAYMDRLANPPKTWKLGDGREVPVKSYLVPKDWRTNKEYDKDYDYVAAFLGGMEPGPVYHGPEEGWVLHGNDIGKMPTHPTFSEESYYAKDPKYAPLAGRWEEETYHPGPAERAVRQDAKGGDASGPETAVSETPVPESPAPASAGPRIVINPQVFEDRRDALCVAFNEAFRIVMEDNGFEPVSEPTDKQRRFFADTAYADDEVQLRRTILARIATLDTSVSDPTDEQLEETAEMLEMVMEVGAPQNEWEQQAVRRLHDVVVKASEGRAQVKEEPLHTEP